MRRAPRKYELMELAPIFDSPSRWEIKSSAVSDKYWVPARPLHVSTLKDRLLIAWKVFKGEFDALEWPK